MHGIQRKRETTICAEKHYWNGKNEECCTITLEKQITTP